MPIGVPHICGCGRKVPFGVECFCQKQRAAERKARFDKTRPTARQRGYDSKWETERKSYLAINRKCRRCSAPATVVDHVRPHRGDRKLFWDRSNWQPLCTSCHSRAKQAIERREAQR